MAHVPVRTLSSMASRSPEQAGVASLAVAATLSLLLLFVASCKAAPGGVGAACAGSPECASGTFCNTDNHCGGEGTCKEVPSSCSGIYLPVCGCDGKTYANSCLAYWGMGGPTVSVAYGGPCRGGAIQACDPSRPCPSDQACVNDPRAACAGGMPCPGVCLHRTEGFSSCGTSGCLGATVNDPLTQQCVRDQVDTCDSGAPCGDCVYSTAIVCDAKTPCPAGQLCMPSLTCGSACASYCAVP